MTDDGTNPLPELSRGSPSVNHGFIGNRTKTRAVIPRSGGAASFPSRLVPGEEQDLRDALGQGEEGNAEALPGGSIGLLFI